MKLEVEYLFQRFNHFLRSDVDFVNKQIHVRAEIAKYNKDRYIDLTLQALTVLRTQKLKVGTPCRN
jgi:hypothetical protein